MRVALQAVLTGRVAPLGVKGAASAIAKTPVVGPVAVGPLGLAGDEQADRRVHGGPEKAVHHYALDHAAAWRGDLPGLRDLLEQPGAFGENFSTHGLTEHDVCVGDLWRVGSALLQVSQARQPCFKLNLRFERAGHGPADAGERAHRLVLPGDRDRRRGGRRRARTRRAPASGLAAVAAPAPLLRGSPRRGGLAGDCRPRAPHRILAGARRPPARERRRGGLAPTARGRGMNSIPARG